MVLAHACFAKVDLGHLLEGSLGRLYDLVLTRLLHSCLDSCLLAGRTLMQCIPLQTEFFLPKRALKQLEKLGPCFLGRIGFVDARVERAPAVEGSFEHLDVGAK